MRYRYSARRVRRAERRGHEGYSLVVVGPDESLFLRACAAFGRWLFRHRSALVPWIILGSAWVTSAIIHHHHPEWWLPVFAVSVVVTVMLGIPHALLHHYASGRVVAGMLGRLANWVGIERGAERGYAAVVIATVGVWMATASHHGPTRSPLPTVALIATVVLGIPWWVHRRRRARVRVERSIAAWPDIAETIGLSGAHIASVVVDAWGWTARLVLRHGKTTGQAIDKIPAIESGFGLRPGSVRVLPDEHRADRCLLRIVETDPHATPIPWPGPSISSIVQPVEVGLFEDGRTVSVSLLRRNALIGGMVGSGKSGIVNVILANLVTCPDVTIWGVDLKGGMELHPWRSHLHRLATTPDQTIILFRDAVTELDQRARQMTASGARLWEPTPDHPALVIVVDEYAELPTDAHHYTDSIARRGRAVAVNLLAATQRPTQDAMGNTAVRSQMDIRLCLRVRERRDVDLILGQGAFSAGWHAHTLTQSGAFLISAPEHTAAHRARSYLITDQQITRHTTTHTTTHAPHRTDTPGHSERPQTSERATAGTEHPASPDTALWAALRRAGPRGVSVRDLRDQTGMSRPTLYRHLRAHAQAGRVAQTRRGYWRAITPPTPPRTPPSRPPGASTRPRGRPRHTRRPPGRDNP